MALVATLSADTFATAENYTDNFDSAHDYQTAGVTGTLWDGLLSNGGFDSQPLPPPSGPPVNFLSSLHSIAIS